MKQLFKFPLFAIIFALILTVSSTSMAFADTNGKNEESINEKFGLPIVVYGEALSAAQKDEVRKLLKVTDTSKVKEITVSGRT